MPNIAYFDIEANPAQKQILDIGAVLPGGSTFHKNLPRDFGEFVQQADFLCGHNIVAHDLTYLQRYFGDPDWGKDRAIDTLLLSPLLFPKQPYHALVKDDKLQTDELNNPVNDAIKAARLLDDEIAAFRQLENRFQYILYGLLSPQKTFRNFFRYINYQSKAHTGELPKLIREHFDGLICSAFDVEYHISTTPIALAYALALLNSQDRYSITPPWVLRSYPAVERLLFLARNTPCVEGCAYCKQSLDPLPALKKHFGFDGFRNYGGEPLQEQAVNAAIRGQSLLAVFPTGGGKSITFQIPALMSGENARALTVVISPLQSLMKDQVDNLEKKGITEAVAINGLLDPIERGKAIERVESGLASILYISPESLRSVTIERLMLKRKIARFVIDEAHCFSSWGQDFRVDYLYIGDFIKTLQEKKNLEYPIPVSCFTATAKQKVIEDIRAYFKEKLGLDLNVFSANTSRTNLHYQVFHKDSEEDKYNQLRNLIETKNCPTIVYVSRTRRAYQLAERLSDDGFSAKPYHGQMDKEEKSENQDAFMRGEVNIMVATSAFGMGVDKSDVGAVIHYDISDSLENYVQEAGRAGRDEQIQADCYVLFNEDDLDKHFIMLNQTKMSIKEINQVWRAIKDMTKYRDKVSNSALEIARKAGWDENIRDVETRVKTAIAALEDAGYLKRGQNNPQLFANSILSKTAQEAINRIRESDQFSEPQRKTATRIIKKLFSSKSKRLSTDEDAESRVDYISDQLGINKEEVIRIIELLRNAKILADTKDLSAFIRRSDTANKPLALLENFRKQEEQLLSLLEEGEGSYYLKEFMEHFLQSGIKDSSLNRLKSILNFWTIKQWIKRQNLEYSKNHVKIALTVDKASFTEKLATRHQWARLIIQYLHQKATELPVDEKSGEEVLVEFSIQELKEMMENEQGMFKTVVTLDDIEDSLFYLSRIEALKIEGGFLVSYNKLTIDRIEKNSRIQYKESDYEKLKAFYAQKVQQIHIVGEYAKKMIRNYNEALEFVDDYFRLNYYAFLSKYFPGSRQDDINRTLTPEKFMKLFGALSPAQLEIIKDNQSQHIVVAAGPGSGKTRVLVHKLASLLLAEDVKHDQLLMLTFSRAAATEFKKRLLELIGNAAHFIDIKTFHSYCFDLLGRIGNIAEAQNVVQKAIQMIQSGEIERSRITKTVLVVDEAQDMNDDEFGLVQSLMEKNEDMRVILVGDDDQNIYGFRNSDSAYMQRLITQNQAAKYELTTNYRSRQNIVAFANAWAATIRQRLKSQPGFAQQQENGSIRITEYSGGNLVTPVAEAIQSAGLTGSTCVLTKTNDEAALLTGILLEQGLPAKLIQTNDGFSLLNLYELRVFSDLLEKGADTPLIPDDVWNDAKRQTNEIINRSNKKDLANSIIGRFEEVNTQRKYKSDWKAFLFESTIEDFTTNDSETILVSTIHKAKGKEFDNVFLLLDRFSPDTNEAKRQFYVAVTRAKTALQIHYTGTYLQPFRFDDLFYNKDGNDYPEPRQIAICLTLHDVQLGYFEYVQHRMKDLSPGDRLTILPEGLGNAKQELLLKFSQAFNSKIRTYLSKNYNPVEARVNFVVYWKNERSKKESKVVLSEILLRFNC
ncbi:MAG: RecQ family ATP-dependent DNA helicase [Chitinophagaceae bacterium]